MDLVANLTFRAVLLKDDYYDLQEEQHKKNANSGGLGNTSSLSSSSSTNQGGLSTGLSRTAPVIAGTDPDQYPDQAAEEQQCIDWLVEIEDVEEQEVQLASEWAR
jgi:hypothetical protein